MTAERLGIAKAGPVRWLDVGGGSGIWSAVWLEANKEATGVQLDWPVVNTIAKQFVTQFSVADRFETIDGDFHTVDFGSASYDFAMYGNIAHQETPANNVAILRKFRKALKPGGTLLINDFVLNDDRTGHPFAMMFASQMLLATTGGNSWCQSDYRAWLGEAGFESVDIVPTPSPATVSSRAEVFRRGKEAAEKRPLGFSDEASVSRGNVAGTPQPSHRSRCGARLQPCDRRPEGLRHRVSHRFPTRGFLPQAREELARRKEGATRRAVTDAATPPGWRLVGKPLVRVTREPGLPGLPIGHASEGVSIGHLDLRQTLGVEDHVLRDDIVDGEQIRGQGVDLVRRERPLSIEWHAPIDVVPDHRGVWRTNREDPPEAPRVVWLDVTLDQPGPAAPARIRSVASRALSPVDELAFLRGTPPRRELLPSGTDGDVPGTDVFVGRGGPNTVSGSLRRGGTGHQR
jgi:hypothetical protein